MLIVGPCKALKEIRFLYYRLHCGMRENAEQAVGNAQK